MKLWPEVHWSEGQFMRPHHLQAAFRNAETLRNAVVDGIQPFAWGFTQLDLAADAIENAVLEIRSCEMRLRDGTWVKCPENCSIESREFKKTFDKSSVAMDVYVGVPSVQAVRGNVVNPGETVEGSSPRYGIDLTERYDENTGDNPQHIEIRRMRGAVFFGDEDRAGFECVHLGQIEKSAAGPKLVDNSVPPLLHIRAWPPLCAAADRIWNDIRSRAAQLGGDAAERGLTFATGSPGDVEQLTKLMALNELETRFGVFASTTDLHPFVMYQALCEAIGKVALWDDLRRPRDLPPYNHDECGPIFAELFRYLRALIDGMLPSDYTERPFEQRDGGFGVDLDYEWFTPNHEMYLGIRSAMQLEEIEALFQAINFKLASPKDASQVFDRRLPGLEFKNAGTIASLPKSADQHYFRISRTPLYWPHCEAERGMFIRMPPQDIPKMTGMHLSLFVIKVGK